MKIIDSGKAFFSNRGRGLVILLFILSMLVLPGADAKKVRRIRFRQGATVAKVRGALKGVGDEALFVLRARSGQHMRVNISGDGPTRGTVTFPSGKQDGQPGGLIFDDALTETGDYRIRVTESSMADSWRGSFVLEVEIR
ncbi:MAG: hypothetical protein ICV60_22630 [Pyrinomonadaceae bacterium]|nr:hypothetical protein [Pyrinomonadaceae bacterium]